jgi:hypothetical protein
VRTGDSGPVGDVLSDPLMEPLRRMAPSCGEPIFSAASGNIGSAVAGGGGSGETCVPGCDVGCEPGCECDGERSGVRPLPRPPDAAAAAAAARSGGGTYLRASGRPGRTTSENLPHERSTQCTADRASKTRSTHRASSSAKSFNMDGVSVSMESCRNG